MLTVPPVMIMPPSVDIGASIEGIGTSSAEANGDDVMSYLDGLFSSVGSENELNRDFNSAEAQMQRDWSTYEAQKARDFEEYMSGTAYQRSVSDLSSAGLNPILAATGAASTPNGVTVAGSSASSSGGMSGSAASNNTGGGDTLSSIISSVAQLVMAIRGKTSITNLYEAIKRS